VLWLFATSDLLDCMMVKAKFTGQYRTCWDSCVFIHADNQLSGSPFTCCQLQLKFNRFCESLHSHFHLRSN
jgi:hypothetical protein